MATAAIERDGGDHDGARRGATVIVLTTAELAECTCPEPCDRDHDRD